MVAFLPPGDDSIVGDLDIDMVTNTIRLSMISWNVSASEFTGTLNAQLADRLVQQPPETQHHRLAAIELNPCLHATGPGTITIHLTWNLSLTMP